MFTDSVKWPFYSPKNSLSKCLAGLLQAWEFSLWPGKDCFHMGWKIWFLHFFSCSLWLFCFSYNCPLKAATHIGWQGLRGSLMLVSPMKGWQPSHIHIGLEFPSTKTVWNFPQIKPCEETIAKLRRSSFQLQNHQFWFPVSRTIRVFNEIMQTIS